MQPDAPAKKSLRSFLSKLKRKHKQGSEFEVEARTSVHRELPLRGSLFQQSEVNANAAATSAPIDTGRQCHSYTNPQKSLVWPSDRTLDTSPRLALSSKAAERIPKCYCSQISNHAPVGEDRLCSKCDRCQVCVGKTLERPFFHCGECKTRLLSFPLELLQEVVSHLDANSTWLLRLSCGALFSAIAAPPNPRNGEQPHEFFHLLRGSIPKIRDPKCLGRSRDYCRDCRKYHFFDFKGRYYRDHVEHCRQYLSRSKQHMRAMQRSDEFICEQCFRVRKGRQCTSCSRCEICAALSPEVERRDFQGYLKDRIRCDECCIHRSKCWNCDRARLQHRGCKNCGMCERCAGVLFQFGRTHCGRCGGGYESQIPSMRRVAVESGPGYELYYYGGEQSAESNPRRIGIGR